MTGYFVTFTHPIVLIDTGVPLTSTGIRPPIAVRAVYVQQTVKNLEGTPRTQDELLVLTVLAYSRLWPESGAEPVPCAAPFPTIYVRRRFISSFAPWSPTKQGAKTP